MLKHHHITLSRLFGGMVFAMALVLTPRAWVDAENGPSPDQIPVEALEPNADCLWCDQAPADCDNEGDTKVESDTEHRYWLNPDQPVPPSSTLPCSNGRKVVPGA